MLKSLSLPMLSLLAGGLLFADQMVVDRGLPIANLNNAAGPNRSNVSWGNAGNQYFTGDDFTIDGSGVYVIDTLRVWTADGPNAAFDFKSAYASLQLYGGVAGSGLSLLQSGDFTVGDALSNANIQVTPVTYADGSAYQGNAANYQLWQVDFTNLNWVVTAGQSIQFGVFGITNDPGYFWVNHASNAALSGSPQQGADGKYLVFDSQNLAAAPEVYDSNGNGWDKSSDINVQVFAQSVPEPGTMVWFGAVAGILVFVRRSRLIRRAS